MNRGRTPALPAYTAAAENASNNANPSSNTEAENLQTSDEFPLPAYNAIFGDTSELLPLDAPPTEHEFSLHGGGLFGNKKPWVTWRILTRSSRSRPVQKVPRYFGGDLVRGSVELRLDNHQNIHSIVVLLKGHLVTGFHKDGTFTFLEHTETVWSKSQGDPRAQPAADASPEQTANTKFEGRLFGNYDFQFSFPFPTEVDLSSTLNSSNKGKQTARPALMCPTPQTLLELHLMANIEYELTLQIRHGILKSDSKLRTDVIFIPEITPMPASSLRQVAYREQTPLSGPSADPEGWITLPSVKISGMFQKTRKVDLELTLSLADPLCYTRGTVIPCYMQISSPDENALSVLAAPKAQNVRLVRRVTFFENPPKGLEQHFTLAQKTGHEITSLDTGATQGKSPRVMIKTHEAEVAVWWTSAKDPSFSSVGQNGWAIKRVEGEIHLAKELVPSTKFLLFSVEYLIEVLPIDTPDFQYTPPSSPAEVTNETTHPRTSSISRSPPTSNRPRAPAPPQAIQSTPVTIATFHANGPRPTVFSERSRPPKAPRQLSENEDDDQDEQASMFLLRYGMRAVGPV